MSLPKTWTLFGKDHLPHRLLLLAKMIDRETAKQLQDEFDISLAEWRVLAFVCASGPASASEIGTAGEADRAEVSRAVRRLIESRRVLRTADETHGKRYIISATPAGRQLFERIRNRRHEYFQTIMNGLDETDRNRLDTLLETLARNVFDHRGS
jgi:DNA-binding MarR family transcriptional regulator